MLQRHGGWLTSGVGLIGVIAAAAGVQIGGQTRGGGAQSDDGPRPPAVTVDPQTGATEPDRDGAERPPPAEQPRGDSSAGGGRGAAIERGRYLVHDVAMCVMCHSPRDIGGQLHPRRLLHGGRIPLESPFPRQEWAFAAPRLAGLPGGWTEERMIELLVTGQRPEGPPPRPPMPPFRMNREDAAAVAAYLKSLD
jgi:cytochrome c553